jgi:hypothetical protein
MLDRKARNTVDADLRALAEDDRQAKKAPGSVKSLSRFPRMKDLPPATGEKSEKAPYLTVGRRRSNLGPHERLVFGTLCDYANGNAAMWPDWVSISLVDQCQKDFSKPDEGSVAYLAWPSIPKICRHTALSERSVQDALRNLERAKAIVAVYRSKGGAPHKR